MSDSLTERIERLFQELEMAIQWDRAAILLAGYGYELVRQEVESRLAERLQTLGHGVRRVMVDEEKSDVPLYLTQQADRDRVVFFVSGLDFGGGSDGQNAYRALNIRREYFVEYRLRVVFWLTERELAKLPKLALDFWVFRQRTVEFFDMPALLPTSRSYHIPTTSETVSANWQALEEEIAFRKRILDPNQAGSLYRLGLLYWALGDGATAERYWRQSLTVATKTHEESYYALIGLAAMYRDTGQYAQALESCQEALTIGFDQREVYQQMAQVYALMGQLPQAEEVLHKAQQLEKGEP